MLASIGMKTATKWTLGILGTAGTIGGLWWLSGRSRSIGYTPGRMAMPREAETTQADGLKLTRYVSSRMTLEQRLAVIQKMVWKGVNDPRMRKIALDITRSCPERDGMCEARAIYDAVKARVRYTGDVAPIKQPNGSVEAIDYYTAPYRTWEIGGEDCDGHSALIAALLSLNGITARLRVTGVDRGDEGSHIYPVALLPKYAPKKAVAVDTTLPGTNRFGVEAPHAWQRDFDA